MAGPVVRGGEPSVVNIEIADRTGQVRDLLSGLGVRRAGTITEIDFSSAMARVGRFFGMERRPLAIDPFVVEVPDDTLRRAARREARGGYVQGTNIIMMSDLAARKTYRPDAGERTMVHELVHYLGFIGNNGQIRFTGEGVVQSREMPEWLSEGLTQSFAELILPSGQAPTYSYTFEVLASVLLERIVGLEGLKEAFRSGDFSAVQVALDRTLGEGTFAALVAKRDGGSAYVLLYGAAFGMTIGQGPVDQESFLSDIRVRGAMKSIELLGNLGFRRLADEARSLRERDDPASRERMDQVAKEIMDFERI